MTSPQPVGPAVRTVFLGSGGFAVPILKRLAGAPEISIVGVVTAPARPAGRQQQPRPTPVAVAAASLGLPIQTPERLRDPDAVRAILDLRPGLLVLADYGSIVPPALLDLPHGALNLHPSLLPRHRGASPIPAAILAGDPITGVSLMRMDAGLDSGPIVAVESLPLQGDETARDLEPRLAELAADLLARSLAGWLAGATETRPQATDGLTLTRPLRREDGRLDPSRPAVELERQVRADDPWPGSSLDLGSERLLVHRATTAPAGPDDRPGTLLVEGDRLFLVTADGRLELLVVQRPGRRSAAAAEFLRGARDLVGRAVAAGARP